MAAFVLGIAGAGIGGVFGYAALGWVIGSGIGSSLFAPTLKHEGPRLSDLKVQSSSWGKMIPIVYGSLRIAGNLIWSTDLRETKHVQDQSAKGGPTVESTSYSYSVSMAISLCEGPIFGIRRIWANGALIYNAGPEADAQTLMANRANHITVYTGSETQLPDPTIEADKGIGKVPAYRGQAYVVLRDFQLAAYGNRIPNLEFEVVQQGSAVGFRQLLFKTNNDWFADREFVSSSLMLSVADGVIRTTRVDSSDSSNAPVRVFGFDGRFLGFESRRWEEQRFLMNFNRDLIGLSGNVFLEIRPDPIRPPPWGDRHFPALTLVKNGVPWWPDSIPSNEALAGAVLSADGARLMLTTFVVTGEDRSRAATAMRWYQFTPDGRLLRSGPVQADPLHQPWFNWEPDVFTVIRARGRAAALESDYDHLWCHTYDEPDSFLYAINADGLLERVQRFHSAAWSSSPAIYADEGQCVLVDDIGVMIFTRNAAVSPAPVTLAQIARDLCTRAGLADDEIDTTQLDATVTGYAIARQTDARSALAPLLRAFHVDAVDSDGQIKFIPRGRAPVATLTLDELGAYRGGDEAADPLQITRAQDADLPTTVSVTYFNEKADYQVGAETRQRLLSPSHQALTEELGIAMTPAQAAQVAEVLLYDAHLSRTTYRFSTTRQYATLEPTDVVQVKMADVTSDTAPDAASDTAPETTQRLRLVKKTDEDGLLRFEAVADEASIYAPVGDGGSTMDSATTIATPGPTHLHCLDIPILRDNDNDAGLYIALGGYTSQWRGATLMRSFDGLGFDNVASVEHGTVTGVTLTTLPPWAGMNVPDEASTVDVAIINGSLASIPFDALLNGGNAALIGDEIVQFRSATLIGPQRYRLGGLLRGRQGTGHVANTHSYNEPFVLLTMAGMLRVNEGTAALNAPRYYKGVSFGSSARSGAYRFVNTGNGLKPYKPVHVAAARQPSGDWLLRWIRRTRIDGLWRDNVDVALGEASEAYELEILFGTTVRRLIASPVPNITYSAAQQIADFGSVQTGLMARLYQLSATVGRSDALVINISASTGVTVT